MNFENNSHISISEIEQDIEDTQKEINQYQEELNVLIKDRQSNKLPIYMKEGKISQRESFIKKLNLLLDYRNSFK